MQLLTVTNVKGGVGKSITSLYIATILANNKNKVLLIDMDSQNSLTSYFVDDYSLIEDKTILEALIGKKQISEVIKEITPSLHFIPADLTLSYLSSQLHGDRQFKLYTVLEPIKDNYDYIVIDTPPSLHIETLLALAISNKIIIPTTLGKWSTRSIDIVLKYIQENILPLQQIIKAKLDNIYILPTKTEKNRSVQTVVLEDLQAKYPDMVLKYNTSRKTEVEKISYFGNSMDDIKTTQAYDEYTKIVENIFGKIPVSSGTKKGA